MKEINSDFEEEEFDEHFDEDDLLEDNGIDGDL